MQHNSVRKYISSMANFLSNEGCESKPKDLQLEARDCRSCATGICGWAFLVEVVFPGSVSIKGGCISWGCFLSHAQVSANRHLAVNTAFSNLPIALADEVQPLLWQVCLLLCGLR